MAESVYPVLVYIYDSKGFHRGSVRANDEQELATMFKTSIRLARQEKREVRITDTGDLLVFHMYRGCVKWDGQKHHECQNCIEPKPAQVRISVEGRGPKPD